MTARKTEAVSVSFHYLAQQEMDGEVIKETPFTNAEFAALSARLSGLQPLDLKDEKVKELLRYKGMVPIQIVESLTSRLVFGQYRGSYWGHAYENTDKGTISADSINLRPFYFLVYLSDSGRIYIGAQYLGQFGDYTGIRNTLVKFLSTSINIVPHSFRLDAAVFKSIRPKEIRVKISRKSKHIEKGNIFEDDVTLVFKRGSSKDSFESGVKDLLVPMVGATKENVQKVVGSILKDAKLMDVKDEDVEDCIIIGDVNGSTRTIYMISQGEYASKFPISVPLNNDGHPEYEPTKKAMTEVLKTHIIALKEGA